MRLSDVLAKTEKAITDIVGDNLPAYQLFGNITRDEIGRTNSARFVLKLTDAELAKLAQDQGRSTQPINAFARAIRSKLKEKKIRASVRVQHEEGIIIFLLVIKPEL